MKSKKKRVANIEFAALMGEMKKLGHRPAEVARRLNKSPGAISQYLSGYTNPSETVMALLRRIEEDSRLASSRTGSKEVQDLADKLGTVKYNCPDPYLFIKELIEKQYEENRKEFPHLNPGGDWERRLSRDQYTREADFFAIVEKLVADHRFKLGHLPSEKELPKVSASHPRMKRSTASKKARSGRVLPASSSITSD